MRRPDNQTHKNASRKEAREPARSKPLRGLIVLTLLIFSGLVLCGCALVGPDYTPPEANAPAQWHTPLEDGLTSDALTPESLAAWWTVLGDPLLDTLEQRAIAGNLDLKAATARVREARALRGISEAALQPNLDGQAAASRSRSSSETGTGIETDFYTVGFDAGWELDVFGGRQRAVEAAQAGLEASQAGLRDVLVSLTAETGLSYVDVRTGQARLAAAMANIASLEQTYDLNLSRYQAGLVDELPVKQSLYILEHTRSQIPSLQAGLAAARNRLAVLLGQDPGTLDDELVQTRSVPVPPPAVAVGVPADALRRRPDIRKAERTLAAATAGIGVATSALYPKFRLFGSIGLESLSLENLPEWASRTWGMGPSVSWKLFDAGAIRQNIAVMDARQEQALIQYQGAVLGALEEVENAMVAYVREQDRRDSLERATTAACQAELLARDRYKIGLVDFNNVLEAQRSRLSFQDELVRSQGQVTAGLIRIYKALGGGWQSMAETPEDKPTPWSKRWTLNH
ncbi:MAG: efflux transporter outer membrane subunit [Pseudomonadota bacterium]